MLDARFKAKVSFFLRPLLLVFLGFMLYSLHVLADDSTLATEECRTYLIANDYLFEQPDEFTSSIAEPKRRKSYPRFGPSAKFRGVKRPITTLFSIHSKEAVAIFEKEKPSKGMLEELFRCRGFGTKKALDPELLEAIISAAVHFESERVEIISAFRSVKFNDSLAKKGRRVAAESKHTQGRALDFRLTNIAASPLGAWLFENFDGGVGTYKNDNFVHIDTGAKRRWRGR